MKNMLLFLQKEIPKAHHLEKEFGQIKEKEWNIRSYINELFVQVGQLFVVVGAETSSITEKGRPIDTIGDELSDILLSLIYLASSQKLINGHFLIKLGYTWLCG